LTLVSFIAQVAFNGLFKTADADIAPLPHIQTLTEDVTSLENQAEPARQQVIGMTGANRDLRQEVGALKALIATRDEEAVAQEKIYQETCDTLAQEQAAHAQLKTQMVEFAPYVAQMKNHIVLDRQVQATLETASQSVGGLVASLGGWLQTNGGHLEQSSTYPSVLEHV
jgi:chromosome segregation ATPase